MGGYIVKTLELLVEIGTEEIPTGYLAPALSALSERLEKALVQADRHP